MNKEQILARLRELRARMAEQNVTAEEINQMTTEVRTLTNDLQLIEQREQLFAGIPGLETPLPKPSNVDNRDATEIAGTAEYRSAWLKLLQHKPLTINEKRAYDSVATNAAVVPTKTMNKIIQQMEADTVLFPLVTRSYIPGNIIIPVESAAAAAAWHTENTQIPGETNSPFKEVALGGFELVKLLSVSRAALLMSIDAFEDYVVQQISRKMSAAIEASIASGAGTTQPTGILTGVKWTATNSLTYAKGSNPSYDNFMAMCKLLKSGYHKNAVWMMSAATLYGRVRTIKDNTGRPLFTPQPAEPFGGYLDGKRVACVDNLAEGTILLGDPRYYHINIQAGVELAKSTESSFGKAAIDYRGYALRDGKPLLDEAFIKMSEATA